MTRRLLSILRARSALSWLDALHGKGKRHLVLVLALALAANAWVLNPATAGSLWAPDAFASGADTAAILSIAEDTDSGKSQLDDPDEGSYSLAYPRLASHDAGVFHAGPKHVIGSHDWKAFPHKTGPPTHV